MEVNEIFKGTFIIEVVELLEQKQFNNLDFASCEEGNEVVGEMTDLEKAIFSLANKKSVEHNNMLNELEEISDEQHKTLRGLRGQVETLKSLCWQIIQDRLNLNGNAIGLSEGCMIVTAHKKDIVRRGSVTIVGIGSFTKIFI